MGLEGHDYSGIDDRSKVSYLIDGINNDKIEVVKTQVIISTSLRQDFTGVCSLFSDYINECEGTNHPVRNISEVSSGSGLRGRVGRVIGHGVRGEQEVRDGDKGPP